MISERYRNVFFDLDGTLIDSIEGVAFSVGAAMLSCGRIFPGGITPRLGPPVRQIFAELLGGEVSDIDSLERAYRASYDNDGWKLSRLVPGAEELLDALQYRPCFLVTNKPKRPTESILKKLELEQRFVWTAMPDTFTPSAKSKGEMIRRSCRLFGARAKESLFIGDTDEDREAAQSCGMDALIIGEDIASLRDLLNV